MTWFRFDDGLPEHPKMLDLSDRAFRVHIEAMAYCSRMSNGGELVESAAKRLHRFTPAIGRELEDKAVWDRTLSGWVIHNWAVRQRTADEISAIREARREAGRRGGLRSAEVRRGQGKAANQ